MILEKKPALNDTPDKGNAPLHTPETPLDAPPAYDAIHASSSRRPFALDSPLPPTPHRPPSILRPWASRPPSSANGYGSSSRSPTQRLQRQAASSSSISSREKIPLTALSAKTQADVRETVRGLVRDLVQGSSHGRSSATASLGILESCTSACSAHHLSLARILQECTIESHSALYWAIVSRRPGDETSRKTGVREDDMFLFALIEQAAPLSPVAVSELRAACLVLSDNVLFQRFRTIAGLVPLSGTDRVLLAQSSTRVPPERSHSELDKRASGQKMPEEWQGFGDSAMVNERGVDLEAGAFSVSVKLRMFQRRMRVSGEVSVEFIARGRLWLLTFFVVPQPPTSKSPQPNNTPSTPGATFPATNTIPAAVLAAAHARSLPPGTWALSLALLEGSPQCFADSRLVISDPSSEPGPAELKSLPELPGQFPTNSDSRSRNTSRVSSPDHPLIHSSQSSQSRSSRFSFFSARSASGGQVYPKAKPPIILNLTCTGSSPLLALPSPLAISYSPFASFLFPGEVDLSNPKSKPRRPSREEKRAMRKAAAKEKRARVGKENKKERKERRRVAQTVLLVGLEEGPGGKKEAETRNEELMYDGCSYLSPNGTLRATLDTRLKSSNIEEKDSDCIIC